MAEARLKVIFITVILIAMTGSIGGGKVLYEEHSSNFESQMISKSLPNGLKIYLKEDHFAPVVAAYLWIRSGSADELDPEAGLAHVHEHMIFKGTAKRPVGQIAKEIESAGGEINAFTSVDQTVYHITIASKYYPVAIEVLADAIANASFDQQELGKELDVILEELKRVRDNPASRLQDELIRLTYSTHPYGRPIIGYEKTLSSFSRDDVLNFFHKHYVSKNMFLVVVGDFKTDEMLRLVEANFSQIPKAQAEKPKRLREPKQKKIRVKIVPMAINKAYISISFHTTSALDKDTPALDLLSTLLATGESSRMYRRIKIEKELMQGVWAQAFTPKEPGILGIGGMLEPEKLSSAIEASSEEVFKLAFEKVAPEELEKAKNLLLSDLVFESETVQGQSRKLGYYIDVANDPDFEKKYIAEIDKLTPDDLADVAKKYFLKNSASIVVLMPETSALPSEDEIKNAIVTGYKDAQNASAKKSSNHEKSLPKAQNAENLGTPQKGYEIIEEKEGITKARLKNGITVLFKPNRSVPTFSIRILVAGGLRAETEKNQGVSNFAAEMLTRGTKNRSYQAIADEVDFLGGVLSGSSGRNTTGISADFLSRHFERAMELVADVTRNPIFPPDEIERKRRELIFAIERRKDDPTREAIDLFCKTLYTHHVYRFSALGSKEIIQTITRDDLIDQHKKLFNPKSFVIAIVGDLDKESALKTVATLYGDWEAPEVKLFPPAPEAKPQSIRVAQEKIEREQCHIIVGFLGNTIYSDDRYAMEVFNAALSSQGGRLFADLRDKEHLAYALTSINAPGVEPGFWIIYLGTRPENLSRALNGIKGEFESLTKNGISSAELDRAKRYLIGSQAIDLQTSASQAMQIALGEVLETGYDEFLKYPDLIESVGLGDVNETAKKYIDINNPVIVTVGPCSLDAKMWLGSN